MSAQLSVSVSGQIRSCTVKNSSDLFCKFAFQAGHEWTIISGIDDGVTQGARANLDNVAIWNYPIDIIFQAPRPSGWPQLIVAVYGENTFGNETVIGYGAAYVPMQPGVHDVNIPLFTRVPSTFTQKFASWFTGSMPETIQFNLIAGGDSREIIKTESNGFISVQFNTILTGLNKLDLIVKS
ncbi:B9 protein [Trichomonas vaginalis G3]|uniref:B9 domain-containing protein 1 n=1 Tax=Trichomonas vaginalis (strain ATCC PRA-98 / G3) TaxID=412133 RepID=A2DRU9_TRIV3|nr:hedgehog receptor protein [Trichomonas vaginalis G3]EAY16896.1 B9 protein [Trichomonas vaginalis G3]KAI5489117.1 hedgehog receptor protein [Trichomonas vaginalis G3]|eukprot:XP_001329119.1 B9 protein [Trichomonas vaginalis G3]